MLSGSALSHMNYSLVSTIAYFSVGANAEGYLIKGGPTTPSAGWAGWNSSHLTNVINNAHASGGRVVLTVTMMGWNTSGAAAQATLLGSSSARARLVAQIVDAVGSRNADGVNLDFEPVPSSLRSQFTSFVRQLKAGLTAAGVGDYLTVCVMAGAATWATGYDVAGLSASGAADHLFVMGYDYHWSGSSRAGGVAPIESPYTVDVNGTMLDFLEETSGSKLIWGVPYYGRYWPTSSDQLNATTLGGGSGALYYTGHRTQAIQHGRLWDPVGKVPWYRYWNSSTGNWVQAYYDDPQSLAAKYNLINARGLAGTGMWTLLMDQGRSELWDLLAISFAPPFDDIGASPFRVEIAWLAAAGISKGCSATSFCPNAAVTRAQMASFLARAMKLPPADADAFGDDDGSLHEGDINRLAAAGISAGCGPGRFCPNAAVTRAQMASFLVRALDLTAGGNADQFDDDDGSQHEADIDRLATAGITSGCGPRRFCPLTVVTREQMAAFLERSFAD
jgi:spore germination protein YaaH